MSKYDELCLLISQGDYDIIALSEIKPKQGSLPTDSSMHIPGYEQYVSNLAAPNTRGVCLYTKQSLTTKLIHPPDSINYSDSVWATITGESGNKLLVGCVYRSGSPSLAVPKDDMLHKLLLWSAEESGHTHKLIAGDFNHPAINWDPTPSLPDNMSVGHPASKFAECVADTFFHQHVFDPTRYRGNQRPTHDDLIFSNEQEMVQQLGILEPLGASDHVGIELNFLFEYRTDPVQLTALNWNKADYVSMRQTLNKDWDNLLQNKTTQEAFDILSECIQEAVDNHVPKRVIDPTTKRFKPLWMNDAALRRAKKKYHAWIRYLNTTAGSEYLKYIEA